MHTLQIVNRFCGFNSFLPTKLYTTNNNWTVVKYDKTERKEYNSFLRSLHKSKIFKLNKIKVVLDPLNNQVGFSPKGYRG